MPLNHTMKQDSVKDLKPTVLSKNDCLILHYAIVTEVRIFYKYLWLFLID